MLEHFTDLDESLAVGSCPRGPGDIPWLRQTHGVTAVVSLQSDGDLRSLGLPWPTLWQAYTRARIAVTRVPITDFDPRDLARRLEDAQLAVTAYVAAGKKAYIHCTAGLNRSPTTLLAHLVAHRGLDVDTALEWLTSRHDCVPYRDVLERWAKRHGHPIHAPAQG